MLQDSIFLIDLFISIRWIDKALKSAFSSAPKKIHSSNSSGNFILQKLAIPTEKSSIKTFGILAGSECSKKCHKLFTPTNIFNKYMWLHNFSSLSKTFLCCIFKCCTRELSHHAALTFMILVFNPSSHCIQMLSILKALSTAYVNVLWDS